MTIMETLRDSTEQEQPQQTEDRLVKRNGVIHSLLRGLLWPFGIVVRTYRGIWWILGVRQPQEGTSVSSTVSSPSRQNLAGRKRLSRVTRLLLAVLPRWVQGALGYPVSSSIGQALSPEIRGSPTKPSGKGSKRKQDELDEEEEEEEDDDDEAEEHPTWVEALGQELADDDAPEEDPDYEPSSIETESEEYRSQNNTESDIELQEKGVVIITDLRTGDEPSSTQSEVSPPAL